MNIAFLCVLIVILLPLVWAGFAKMPNFKAKTYDNHNPRILLEHLQGPQQRANWAQINSFEAMPGFIGAVVIATIAGVAQSTLDTLAVIFVLSRLAHGFCYIKDYATARSLVWGIGLVCVISLIVLAL